MEGIEPVTDCEARRFAEDISRCFGQMGLPPMAGRVLGVLLISDPPAQSLTDLCEVLRASKSSISTTTRLVSKMGLIERVATPVPRQVYFRFSSGGWMAFLRQQFRLWTSLHQIAEQGLGLRQDRDPALQERLQQTHDMFSRIEEDLPALLERVEDRRRR